MPKAGPDLATILPLLCPASPVYHATPLHRSHQVGHLNSCGPVSLYLLKQTALKFNATAEFHQEGQPQMTIRNPR